MAESDTPHIAAATEAAEGMTAAVGAGHTVAVMADHRKRESAEAAEDGRKVAKGCWYFQIC